MIYTTKKSVVNAIPIYLAKFEEVRDIVEEIDHRITIYVESNLNIPENHNMYEILSVFRFIDYFDKYGFATSKYRQFVKYYENMAWPSDRGMQSFKLTPPQAFQFANIFG